MSSARGVDCVKAQLHGPFFIEETRLKLVKTRLFLVYRLHGAEHIPASTMRNGVFGQAFLKLRGTSPTIPSDL